MGSYGNVLVVGIDYGLIMAYPIKVMNHPICGIFLINTNFPFFFFFLFAPFLYFPQVSLYSNASCFTCSKSVGRIFSLLFFACGFGTKTLCHET
jgi:hypothetical protein